MIVTNSAIYLGMMQACVLEQCPAAVLHTARVDGGYIVTGMVKSGTGADAKSMAQVHAFRDAETMAALTGELTAAARMAGDGMGRTLAAVR